MKKQIDMILLWTSIGSFLLMSLSFLLMPLEKVGYLPGVLFWLGLLTGIATQIALEVSRRRFFAYYRVDHKTMQKPRCGALTFFSNQFATAADSAMFAGIAAVVLSLLLTNGTGYVCFVCIAIALFSLCMHCVLNGRNYFHVMNRHRVRQVLEQKKVSKGEGKK